MIVVESFEQYSEKWFEARSFGPTASQFDRILTTTGKPSAQRKKYLYQLAGERLLGRKEETYQSAAMTRGIELEPEARETYKFISGNDVREVALVYKDGNKLFSGSPDGLIWDGKEYCGGLEIKCPLISTHAEYLYNNKLPSTYFQQVQGYLFITGMPYWDFFSYYPMVTPLLVRVEPDIKWHKMLVEELDKFCMELDETVERIRA